MTPRVLVTDAQMRNSLAIIRSLGRHGLQVTAGESTRFATAFWSRYCHKRIIYPNPFKHPQAFVEHLLKEVKNGNYDVIFPVTDVTVSLIARHKKDFERYTRVPLPDYEVFSQAEDKARTIEIAQKIGVTCPRTIIADNISDIDSGKEGLPFPLVIKPRRSSGSRGLALCRTREELLSRFPKISAEYGPCLVQEYIPPGGEELGVYMLLNPSSELRALTVQKRLRSYPVSGGPSTLRETVKRPGLEEVALRLLQAMKWSGVAMVEFRTDPRDGQARLMEVNPRWWGSLQLSILAGVDFPYLLYRQAMNGDTASVLEYKTGIRCRWLLPGDILWYLSSGRKLRNLPTLLKCERNDDMISWSDPLPTLGFFLASLRFAFDKSMWKFVLR